MLLDIRPDHLQIVQAILQKHIPEYEVWAFGSRAKWKAKEYSDLDLCVITKEPLSFTILGLMAEDFSESDLPWKVDVVDWSTTNESFQKIIEKDKVVIQKGRPTQSSHAGWVTTAEMLVAEQRMELSPSESSEALPTPKDASTTQNVGLRCANPTHISELNEPTFESIKHQQNQHFLWGHLALALKQKILSRKVSQ